MTTNELELLRLLDRNVELGKRIALRNGTQELLVIFENIQDLTELLIKKNGRSKN